MVVKLDKFGRIVLPKPVRDRLGLKNASALELIENEDGIQLKVVEDAPAMIRVGKLWVYSGAVSEDLDWESIVGETRNSRIDQLAR